MDILIALVMFGIGLGLIIFFAEQLVKGVVGTSLGFGLSAFLLSVIFIGFDPDNLAVGAVASGEGLSGITLGSILGGAMVLGTVEQAAELVGRHGNRERSSPDRAGIHRR